MGDEGGLLTDDMIRKIIEEPKFMSARSDPMNLHPTEDGRFLIGSIGLECISYDCHLIIRQSIDRPTNFSIVLVYRDPDRNNRAILRLNGNHGRHTNRLEKNRIDGPHIHKMTERYQRRTTHPDGYAEATDLYTDLEGALRVMMELANIRYAETRDNRRLEEFDDGSARRDQEIHLL